MDNNFEIFRQLSIDKGNDGDFDIKKIKSIIEAMLFTSGEPLKTEEIANALQITKADVRKIINEMIVEFDRESRGIKIICFNDKYQMCTRPEYMEYIKRLINPQNRQSLSRAAIETVAIIAYKQPITRMDIDSIRGVKSDRVIGSLLEKKLIRDVGRLDAPGRPILYGTTDEFLKYFGLRSLSQLPKLEDFTVEV